MENDKDEKGKKEYEKKNVETDERKHRPFL